MKKKITILLICLLIIGVGVFSWFYYSNTKEETNTNCE